MEVPVAHILDKDATGDTEPPKADLQCNPSSLERVACNIPDSEDTSNTNNALWSNTYNSVFRGGILRKVKQSIIIIVLHFFF